jgi:hypothetical protein
VIVRARGARLAVLLTTVTLAATTALAAGTFDPDRAEAVEGCDYSIDGINCWFVGSATSTTTLPPLRYLRTRDEPGLGTCWYWSRYGPGLDALSGRDDEDINRTRLTYPECGTGGSITTRAWEVFRSFPLRVPVPDVAPTVGITNLASIVTTTRPNSLNHRESLPDGRILEVQAFVASLRVAWGDGSPVISYPASDAFNDGAAYAYPLKTCPAAYRQDHPAGPRCHPTLERYPVTVSFAWLGRYRVGAAGWVNLGTLLRSASFLYDVDEVVGIPIAP